MRILTQTEHEDLIDHFTTRVDIWQPHSGSWFRRARNEQGNHDILLALRIAPSSEGLWAMSLKEVGWPIGTANEYIEWLLDKYTAYGTRMKVIEKLQKSVKLTVDVHVLSRDICELQGGTFIRKREA